MRLVFINHAHPDTPHVSAMRMYYFAKAMAARGHRVVLLTGESPTQPAQVVVAGQVAAAISAQDWTRPLVLPVSERSAAMQSVVRDADQLPPLVRKARTAWRLLCGDGIHGQWVANARPVLDSLSKVFEPDLAWATFGNTSNLRLGQWLVQQKRCCWVADIKDNWREFIPRGLRQVVAWRFRDASGLTANAHLNMQAVAAWGGSRHAAVIYSGVADAFFRSAPNDDDGGYQDVLLVGSTYSSVNLQRFITALAAWIETLPAQQHGRLRFLYAGTDVKQVAEALQVLPRSVESRILSQLPVEELAKIASRSLFNCYIASDAAFHHKLLELLVIGRPVVCFPSEHPESMQLAANVATGFHVCADSDQLRAAFETNWSRRMSRTAIAPPAWHWDDFAVELESFFARLI